jgi:hypothetical protein
MERYKTSVVTVEKPFHASLLSGPTASEGVDVETPGIAKSRESDKERHRSDTPRYRKVA